MIKRYNIKSFIRAELLVKIIEFLLIALLSIILFDSISSLNNYNYLNITNIINSLTNVYHLILFIFIILSLIIFILLDVSMISILYNQSYYNKKIDYLNLINISILKTKKIFRFKYIILIVLLLPFFNIDYFVNYLLTFRISNTLIDFICNDNLLFIKIISYLLLSFILIKWINSINYVLINDTSVNNSFNKSHFLRKNYLYILAIKLINSLVYFGILILGIYFIIIININLIHVYSVILLIISLFVSNFINVFLINYLFYKDNKTMLIKYDKNNINYKYVYVLIISLFAAFILTFKNIDYNIDGINRIEYTAHRGYSFMYPENTMLSYKKAIEEGAKWIEVDVVETKDKKLVLCHDTDLLRISGVEEEIINLTYDEILEYEVGGHFSSIYYGEKMPLFESVLKLAKDNNINLNIELKSGNNIEEYVINMIKEYSLEKNVLIASFDYEVLEKVKEIDSNIKTVYNMYFITKDVSDYEYADIISLEVSKVTDNIINNIHNNGKKIFVWTVNDEEEMDRIYNYKIDNIITDNIGIIDNIKYRENITYFINNFIKNCLDN